MEAHFLDIFQDLCRPCHPGQFHHFPDNVTKRLLGQQLVDKAYFLWHHIVKEYTAHGGFHHPVYQLSLFQHIYLYLDIGVKLNRPLIIGYTHLFRAEERSEEHTSELQSLMRISYAVFCLKKKKQTTQNLYNN